jgi:uncharacterized tellurite resistance protein B-like protein
MSISDVFQTGEQRSNLAYFNAMVNLALADGVLCSKENKALQSIARKLNITEQEVRNVLKGPQKYPQLAIWSLAERREHLGGLFTIVYADGKLSKDEGNLIYKYALGLGFPYAKAKEEIEQCIRIFGGGPEFED